MRQVIYGDVLFFTDFSIDLLVLLMAGYFLSLRRRPSRLSLAGVLGGAYSLFSVWLSPSPLVGLLLHLGVASLLCFVAYGPLGPRAFLKLYLLFYGAALLLGGAVNALYSILSDFFGTDGIGGTNALLSSKKAGLFLLYAVGSAIILLLTGRLFSRRDRHGSVMLEIEEDGRRVTLSALVDSGNLLADPLTGRPVILIRREEVGGILPGRIFYVLESGRSEEERELPHAVRRKLRIIPMQGIDGARVLVGYVPDSILVFHADRPGSKHAVDAILAIYEGKTRDFGGHGAILPPRLCL